MNLTELQMQLRSIEEHISDLQAEIEKMKPQPEDEKKAMFEKTTKLAKKFPLNNRRFPKFSNVDVKTYISCLAYISLADDCKIYDKLLYLCRLSHGMGLPITSEDLYRIGLEFDEKDFDKNCSVIKDQKYSFLVDALILVNITEEATEASFRLIADIANNFGCGKEEFRTIAMVAKAVLTDNYDVLKNMPVPNKNQWMGQFKEIIPPEWIRSQRKKCGMICIEKLTYLIMTSIFGKDSMYTGKDQGPCVVKKQIQAETIVHKGDILVSYEEYEPPTRFGQECITKEKTITSPCNGVVFFMESDGNGKKINKGDTIEDDVYLEVYVVSYFDDYSDFCEWHKKQ